MKKLVSLLIITLSLFYGSSVFAAENGDTTTTTVTYTVPESFVWTAPTDVTFDAADKIKTSTLVVSENIIPYNSFLVISIPEQEFVLTSSEGATRNYKVYLGENELTAGNEVLRIPAGTTEGSVDINFKVPQVENIKAGTYTGTLNFVAKVTGDYGITYYLNGGTNNASNPSGYKMNEGDVTILEPTKLGYTFAGWYDNAEFTGSPITKIANGTSGNVNLYAKWSASSYTINYNLDGGTNNPSNPSTYTADMLPLTLEAPTKDGYVFLGWNDGSNDVTGIPVGTTGTVSLTARWEKSYAITYNLDGGTLSGDVPTGYTSSAGLSTLPTPTKDGYVFVGWQEIDDVPVTINDNWGKNEDGSIYLDYNHYDPSASTYAADPGSVFAYRYNSLEFVLSKSGILNLNIEIYGVASAPTIYQIIKDNNTAFESQEYNRGDSPLTISHNLEVGEYQIIFCSYTGYHDSMGPQSTTKISNISVQSVAELISIPSGTTGDKTLTAKWEKALAKGDIVTLADLGLTDVDLNEVGNYDGDGYWEHVSFGDGVVDTFRVLSVEGTQVKLLAMDFYMKASFGSENTYSGSYLDTKMTNYYNALPADVQSVIVEQNINQSKYNYSDGTSESADFSAWYRHSFTESDASGTNYYLNRATEANVGNRKVYALDVDDVIEYLGSSSTPQDVNEMFFNQRSSVSREVHLRSAYTDWVSSAFVVFGNDGIVSYGVANSNYEVRPAFVLDLSLLS